MKAETNHYTIRYEEDDVEQEEEYADIIQPVRAEGD